MKQMLFVLFMVISTVASAQWGYEWKEKRGEVYHHPAIALDVQYRKVVFTFDWNKTVSFTMVGLSPSGEKVWKHDQSGKFALVLDMGDVVEFHIGKRVYFYVID